MLLDLLSLLLLRHSDIFGDIHPLLPGLEGSAHACIPCSESCLFPHMSCRPRGLLHVCRKEIITCYQGSQCIGPDEAFLLLNSLPQLHIPCPSCSVSLEAVDFLWLLRSYEFVWIYLHWPSITIKPAWCFSS